MKEGDTVTFGHRNGEKIAAGTYERQPNSEHQFVVSGISYCLLINVQVYVVTTQS